MQAWLLLSGAAALRDKPGQTPFSQYANFDEEGGDLATHAEALAVIDADVPRTSSQSMTQRVWRELIGEKDREVCEPKFNRERPQSLISCLNYYML